MSGLAAAISWDGADCSAALAALAAAGRHRAPDGITTWSVPGASLARLHRLVFEGQSIDAQPAVSRDCSHAVVFDGRLDNREALSMRLPAAAPADDDAGYVLHAVQSWGEGAAAALDGDFAFVAWNAPTRTLMAARDPL